MTKQEAFQTLSQLAAIYKGTLQEHKILQDALDLVRKEFDIEYPAKPEVDKSEATA